MVPHTIDAFRSEAQSLVDKARRDLSREISEIVASQSKAGLLQSGATPRLLASAANASLLGLSARLYSDAANVAPSGSGRLRRLQEVVAAEVEAYRLRLWAESKVEAFGAVGEAGRAVKKLLEDGAEDERREAARFRNGLATGVGADSWLKRHETLAWLIGLAFTALAAAGALLVK